jgi:hypothetical protein
MKFNFVKPTLISCAIGIFIPGFTAILFFLLQLLTDKIGVECRTYWKSIWFLTSIISVASPFFFIENIKKTKNPTLTKLTLFNFIEYICLQASLAQFFTNSKTICYGSGGQNGIELVFTAWVALPILVCISFVFKQKLENYIE